MALQHGFELLNEQTLPELKTQARYYRHVHSGAQLLSLENDDENKVFGIVFRTPPTDSTGVAHIMEHSVLCGSRKYPVKEPFVELIKGSLNTFLNAFTFPDKTCYPVASQNLKDFYNLIDVYMDAVFHPLIPPHTLQQEGWHYELESLEDVLSYRGVVFNEMKGEYSNPDSMLGLYTRQSLFPDSLYSVDFGGDPRFLPDLTYEAFKAFHERYYHPSNARIYMYGDDDPDERLRRLDGYLQEFNAIQIDSAVPLQARFDQPRRIVHSFDPGEEQDARKGMLVVNWMLDEMVDPQTALGMQVLTHILVGTPAAPLRKALIESGLGEDLAGGGLEGELRQPLFSIGLKGVATGEDNRTVADNGLEKGDQIEGLILQTLQSLAKDGIDPDTVAASVNTIEFHLRENNTGSFPRGLLQMLRSMTVWLYDGDPLAPLAFERPLEAIKAKVAAKEPYFEALIQRCFLENLHRATLVMQPEPGLNQKRDEDEKDRLAKVRAILSKAELQAVVDNTQRLKRLQETPDTPEALATLPALKLDDLEKMNKLTPLTVSEMDGCKIFYHDLFTNGILYLDVGFNLHTLPQEYLPYISLYSRALLEMGTEKEDFVKLSQRIGQSTGGIRPASFTSLIRGTSQGAAWLFLRGKATLDRVDEFLAILRDVLLSVRLDNPERFRQMVLEEKAEQEAMLAPAGHRVVNSRLRAKFNEADWASEQMGGVSYLFFLRDLAQEVEKDWSKVLGKLQAMHQILVNRTSMLCNITLDQANWKRVQPRLGAFLNSLPAVEAKMAIWQPGPMPGSEGLTIPAQVNYVGKGANLFQLGYQANGSISVVLNYLQTTWLWERVRVRGGAYGGFRLFDQRSGVFTYLSYRDPNLLSTLDNYDQAGGFLRQLDLSPAELTKSIVGAIGDMDAYQFPDAKGYSSLLRSLAGDSDESRQLWREQILSASPDDFHKLGELLDRLKEQSLVVVMGSQEAIQEASAGKKDWLQIQKLL